MTETPQISGKDLARQALAAYKATSRTAPANTPAKARRKRATRRPGDGREPVSFAAAIAALGADIPMEAGIAGGSITDRWPELCPQYAGHIEPAGYDEATGRLDLRPGSHAYAAQLRMFGGQLARQINDKMGKPVVRTIRVLPVGNLAATASAAADVPTRTEPEAPVKTRENASPGYRATLQAALAHRLERPPAAPYEAEALARQEAALRAGRQRETEHRDAVWAEEEAQRKAGPAPGSMEASEAAARAYARQARAGRTPRRAFDVA